MFYEAQYHILVLHTIHLGNIENPKKNDSREMQYPCTQVEFRKAMAFKKIQSLYGIPN